MYCSGCGLALPPGQGFCPQCGRPAAMPIPPVHGLEFEVQNYAGKIKTLGVFWIAYAGFSLLTGFIGLAFAKAFLAGHFGYWAHGPMPPICFLPVILHFAWFFLLLRTALALAAGWGLMERAPWGRTMAIVAAFVTIFTFSHLLFGTAIGIWTLVVLLGYRNASLYEEL